MSHYTPPQEAAMPLSPRPGETPISAFIRRHGVLAIVVAVSLDVALTIGMLFLYRVVSNVQDCQGGYIDGVTMRSVTRDKAVQVLIDDIAAQVSERTFLADVKAEQAANQALADYRLSHVPKESC